VHLRLLGGRLGGYSIWSVWATNSLRKVLSRLPDLDALDPHELKALIVSQHELIVSRDSEIEQLKLLIAKLRRMQFGERSAA
jgi:hypothetical protein